MASLVLKGFAAQLRRRALRCWLVAGAIAVCSNLPAFAVELTCLALHARTPAWVEAWGCTSTAAIAVFVARALHLWHRAGYFERSARA